MTMGILFSDINNHNNNNKKTIILTLTIVILFSTLHGKFLKALHSIHNSLSPYLVSTIEADNQNAGLIVLSDCPEKTKYLTKEPSLLFVIVNNHVSPQLN